MAISSYRSDNNRWFWSNKYLRKTTIALSLIFCVSYISLFLFNPPHYLGYLVFSLPVMLFLLYSLAIAIHNSGKTNKWFFQWKGSGWVGRTAALSPITWQGWLTTVGYFMSLVFVPLAFFTIFKIDSDIAALPTLLVLIFLLTGLYVFICYKKS
jgi:hypothetical protein